MTKQVAVVGDVVIETWINAGLYQSSVFRSSAASLPQVLQTVSVFLVNRGYLVPLHLLGAVGPREVEVTVFYE